MIKRGDYVKIVGEGPFAKRYRRRSIGKIAIVRLTDYATSNPGVEVEFYDKKHSYKLAYFYVTEVRKLPQKEIDYLRLIQ